MSNIAQRPNKKWRARYRDDQGREFSRHFDRKLDAKQWLDEVAAARHSGTYVDPRASAVSFEGYYTTFRQRQRWSPNYIKAMDLAVSAVPFRHVPLAKLSRTDLELWLRDVDGRLAPGTIRTRFNNVRTVLRAAVRDRVLAQDPSVGVSLPRRPQRQASMTIPTLDQVQAVLRHAPGQYRALFAVAAFAGLRLGEAAALQVGDLVAAGDSLRVSRQVQRAGRDAVEIRPPKARSDRHVPVPRELAAMLREREMAVGRTPGAWLFVGQSGTNPPHQNSVGHAWRKSLAAAGLHGIRFHDLRHFYASALIRGGHDVVTVQRALGHANATLTLNTYSHVWSDANERVRETTGALMSYLSLGVG